MARQTEREWKYQYRRDAVYSIKSDKLCHWVASNESVLMTVPLTTRTATVSNEWTQTKRSIPSTSGERQFCLILSTFIFAFTSTNSKYLPIHFKWMQIVRAFGLIWKSTCTTDRYVYGNQTQSLAATLFNWLFVRHNIFIGVIAIPAKHNILCLILRAYFEHI